MDNCGFHHGHLTEPVLRDMLDKRRSTYFAQASLFATFQDLQVLLLANQSFLELPSRTS